MGLVDSDAAAIRARFERVAPIYDRLNDWLSWGQHRIWKRMTVKWVQPQRGDTVLDLCCGSGDLARLLAHAVGPTGQVVGADFAPAQLAIARQRTPPAPRAPPIRWLQADALDLPFARARFDGATLGYGWRNVADRLRCLQELHRILKPGARAAILEFNRPQTPVAHWFQRQYLNAVVVPAARQLGLEADYAYLAASVERFLDRGQQLQLAERAGFARATHYPIAHGLMGVLVLQTAPYNRGGKRRAFGDQAA
jgi:demethylmenaquinone methyltransferase/2-methoxy-6-polyprenyl-1,4-benzoquinol methylase